MVQQENAKGRIADVIGGARRSNPQHEALKELEAKWLRTASADETSRLESMVVAALNYEPAGTWLQQLQASFRWICRVERKADGKSIGTGFLIDDDLVLTNYHVLFGTDPPGTPEPALVQLRFDAVGSADGRPVNVATEGWLVAKYRSS
jgi:S1-C subfamily serine protease